MVGVDALLAVAQEVLHGGVCAGGDADLVARAPHLYPHQHNVDVQLAVQLPQQQDASSEQQTSKSLEPTVISASTVK